MAVERGAVPLHVRRLPRARAVARDDGRLRTASAPMSVEAMVWVLRHSDAKLSARLTLLALADFAHPDGSEAYPSVDTIARHANISRRSAQVSLRTLEDDGMIVR